MILTKTSKYLNMFSTGSVPYIHNNTLFLVSVCCWLCPLLLLDQEEPQLQDVGEAKLWQTERKKPGKHKTLFKIRLQ